MARASRPDRRLRPTRSLSTATGNRLLDGRKLCNDPTLRRPHGCVAVPWLRAASLQRQYGTGFYQWWIRVQGVVTALGAQFRLEICRERTTPRRRCGASGSPSHLSISPLSTSRHLARILGTRHAATSSSSEYLFCNATTEHLFTEPHEKTNKFHYSGAGGERWYAMITQLGS